MAKVILILFFIWWFNNYTLKINEKHISSDKVNNDVKLAVLSDLHAYDGIFSIDNKTIVKNKRIDPDAACVLEICTPATLTKLKNKFQWIL